MLMVYDFRKNEVAILEENQFIPLKKLGSNKNS